MKTEIGLCEIQHKKGYICGLDKGHQGNHIAYSGLHHTKPIVEWKGKFEKWLI